MKRKKENMKGILYNPVLWFFLMPAIVVPLVNVFVPFESTAFANALIAQRTLENEVKSIQQEIDQLQGSSVSDERQKRLNDLQFKLQGLKNKLKNYNGSRRAHLNNVYFPFYILLVLAVLFLGTAITWRLTVPLFLRCGGIATGTIFLSIFLAQYITAIKMVPAYGYVFVSGAVVCIIICWIYFLRGIYNNKF